MQMDASMNIDANILMGGKSKNIILLIIKCILADKVINARSVTAPTIIQRKIRDSLLINSLKYSLKTEEQQFQMPKFINLFS